MPKSHVVGLLEVYKAVFQDILYSYPALELELSRDLARIHDAATQRGIHALCVDLPALCKHLDRCLAEGKYVPSGLPLSSAKTRGVPIPKFLGGLYLLVFDRNGDLKGDADVHAIRCIRQVLQLAKAAKLCCSVENVRTEVRTFLEVDDNLPEPESFWHKEETDRSEIEATYTGFSASQIYSDRVRELPVERRVAVSTFLRVLDVVSGIVVSTLGPYQPSDWRFRHGPGAVAHKTGPTDKYSWVNWSNRLHREFPVADYGFHNLSSWADACGDSDFWVESQKGRKAEFGSEDPYSRLVSVPKTFLKPRLIACEPMEHQWCQQNVWDYFANRVGQTWLGRFIVFDDQTRNQELCTRGSLDGSLATVDLSAASDRVTCHAVGQLFRGNPALLLALQAVRTRRLRQTLVHDAPGEVMLKKFSTMGSACTFPVETLLFFCVVVSAILATRQKRPTPENIRALIGEVTVFGDDIVVPVDSRELVVSGLEVLHFKINDAKTFWTGKFRESCGVDAFRGQNVTAVKWKGPYNKDSADVSSLVDVANNFYSKFFVNTSALLESTLRWASIPTVPMSAEFAGFKSFCRPSPTRLPKARWNESLQRTEFWVPIVKSVQPKRETSGDEMLFQWFTESPSPFDQWSGGTALRPQSKLRFGWVAAQDLGWC